MAEDRLEVVVRAGSGRPIRLAFAGDEFTIGRVAGNDLVLPKGNVSKRHARFIRQGGQVFVVDLKSSNGVFVNGRRVAAPTPVGPADSIAIGDFVLRLEGPAAPPAAPLSPEAASERPRGVPEPLRCPHCGAPLHVFAESGAAVTCIYCGSSSRI